MIWGNENGVFPANFDDVEKLATDTTSCTQRILGATNCLGQSIRLGSIGRSSKLMHAEKTGCSSSMTASTTLYRVNNKNEENDIHETLSNCTIDALYHFMYIYSVVKQTEATRIISRRLMYKLAESILPDTACVLLQALNCTNQHDIHWKDVYQSDCRQHPGTQRRQMQDVAEKHQRV